MSPVLQSSSIFIRRCISTGRKDFSDFSIKSMKEEPDIGAKLLVLNKRGWMIGLFNDKDVGLGRVSGREQL